VPKLKDRFGDTRSIEFGWGDKGFYQSKEITSGLTLRSILWSTESVVHAVSVPQGVYEHFPNSDIKELCLRDEELEYLVSFISNRFSKNIDG